MDYHFNLYPISFLEETQHVLYCSATEQQHPACRLWRAEDRDKRGEITRYQCIWIWHSGAVQDGLFSSHSALTSTTSKVEPGNGRGGESRQVSMDAVLMTRQEWKRTATSLSVIMNGIKFPCLLNDLTSIWSPSMHCCAILSQTCRFILLKYLHAFHQSDLIEMTTGHRTILHRMAEICGRSERTAFTLCRRNKQLSQHLCICNALV